MKNKNSTLSARFESALEEVREAGVEIHENFIGDVDCHCCANVQEYMEDPLAPVVWNSAYGNFGFEWDGDVVWAFSHTDPMEDIDDDDDDDEDFDQGYQEEPYREYSHKLTSISFNHDNGGGAILAEAFRNAGFKVDWADEIYKVTIQL